MNSAMRSPARSGFGTRNPALSAKSFDNQIARAGAQGEKGMTATGTYLKAGFLFVLFLGAAFFGWRLVETIGGEVVNVNVLWLGGSLLSVIALGLLSRFAGRYIWVVAIGYALAQGVLTGSMAHFLETVFPGIVMQAVFITL